MVTGIPYLFIAACFYALGVVGGAYIAPPTIAPLLLLFVTFPLLLFTRKGNHHLFLSVLFLQVFLLGLSLTGLVFLSYLAPNSFFNLQGEEVHLLGRIHSIPRPTTRGYTFTVKPQSALIEGEVIPINAGLLHAQSSEGGYSYGDLLEIQGRVHRPLGMKNPGGFSYRNYLYRQGIVGTLFLDSGSVMKVKRGRWGLFYLAQALKEWAGERIEKGFSSPYAAMVRALLLGERELLPPSISHLFRETGLGHLLAVSGLHVGIISLFLWRLFLLFKLNEKQTAMLLILFIGFYMMMCGLRPSIVRAGLVVIFHSISRIAEREMSILDLTGLSALLLLINNPFHLFEVGFQLSYLVYLSIICLAPLLKPLASFLPEKIGLSFSLSLAAQLGAWPVMAYYFHGFSLWPILANVIAIPLLSVILTIILPALFISLFSFSLFRLCSLLISLLLQALLYLMEFLANIPIFFIQTGEMKMPFLLLYFLLLSLLILYLTRRRSGLSLSSREKKIAILLSILVFIQIVSLGREGEGLLKAYFLDVGPGLAIFLTLPSGENLFYDGGGIYSFHDPGANRIADEVIHPLLAFKGIKEVDGVIISHYHLDHVLGLLPLLERGGASFIASPRRGEDLLCHPFFWDTKELAYQSQTPLFFFEEGDHLRFGEVLFRVLAPPPGLLLGTNSDENNNSLVIRVEYGEITILLTGDMEREMEEWVLGERHLLPYLNAHILQVGHHGSNTSSTAPFLEAVKPRASIISSAPHRFDHPSPRVLERLSKVGTTIFRTDTLGAIVVETDGQTVSVYPYWRDRSNFRLIAGGEGSY